MSNLYVWRFVSGDEEVSHNLVVAGTKREAKARVLDAIRVENPGVMPKDIEYDLREGNLEITRLTKVDAELVSSTDEESVFRVVLFVKHGVPDPAAIAEAQNESRIYAEQERWIRKNCGKDAAEKANYGWGVSGTDDFVSIATKVYGHGILTSEAYPGDPIQHDWRPFNG